LRGLPDGGLEWTTPTGQTMTTHPPRFGADDDLRPQKGSTKRPENAAGDPPTRSAAPVLDLGTRILGRPADPGDEPAPF
jgi:hypothetical protein